MARHNRKHDRKKQIADPAPKKRVSKPADPAAVAQFSRKIQIFLQTTARRQLRMSELANKCRAKRSPAAYRAALDQLLHEGVILEKRDFYVLCSKEECFRAEVSRLSGTFGFVRDENGAEYFVAGKFLMGSMPHDKVLCRILPPRNEGSPEAEVLSILEPFPEARLCGTIVPTDEGLCLAPDRMGLEMRIDYKESVPYAIGDKVLAVLTERGRRHMDHRVRVVLNFGTSDSAENCMASSIAAQEIPVEFPEEVLREAEKLEQTGITPFDVENRRDLRGIVIFTIDGAHSKDLDDAVSVEKQPDGSYTLGVHIADVSHYVRGNSPLDAEAFRRGTSIYYADKVIPMLPKALSNGICSLNGGEDRLAISALMHISAEGDLLEAEFCKSVICSRVRGVYSECNAILNGTADADIQAKYAPVADTLHLLDELTDKLEHIRKLRGAPELESTESALLLDENGICVGLSPIERGRSECIIEACMLAANEAAARLAREKGFPLVYRVHEEPAPERIANLKEMLVRLGGTAPTFAEASPRDIQKLLDDCREEVWYPVINSLTLRSMAKAKYSAEPLGHFGLALRDYAHFTSPIRRYPDLCVHRILTDYLAGASQEWMQKRYAKFAENAAAQSSDTEIRAVQIEREADDCYAAEYMRSHIGEEFDGVITTVTEYGVYVMLENHAEGLYHIHDMPEGEYEIEDGWYLRNAQTGETLRLGDAIRVVCAKADVASGRIDLVAVQNEELGMRNEE
ncbi:MAG: ribonuclease R [Oscillospiraceae bacterium]|nr:ribonuclease R [Oscillospiraceae bacterium]